jgi:hypothetical protein
MGLFWMSDEWNDGIGLSAPTPTSKDWRPSEDSVAIVVTIIRWLLTAMELLVLESNVESARSNMAGERGSYKSNIGASSLSYLDRI